MRKLFVLAIALMLTACGGARPKMSLFVVAEGSSLKAAAAELEKAGAIDLASAFLRNAKIFGSSDPIKPGEYEVKAGMDNGDVLALLQSGKTKQRFVTIPEGMPSILVYEKLMATPLLTGAVDAR